MGRLCTSGVRGGLVTHHQHPGIRMDNQDSNMQPINELMGYFRRIPAGMQLVHYG